jgi:hypothetical protein
MTDTLTVEFIESVIHRDRTRTVLLFVKKNVDAKANQIIHVVYEQMAMNLVSLNPSGIFLVLIA